MSENNNILYDEVHTIMIKELLTFFKRSLRDIESEVPYNYYGNRGSVDIIEYKTLSVLGKTHQILRMFELESRISRLEELIRKLKDRLEYFPRDFENTRRLPKLDELNLFLVLLGTMENWKVVNKYLVNFKSAFGRINKIFPKDVLSKTIDPSDDNFYAQIIRVNLVFFDPLKVRQIDVNEDLISNDDLVFSRLSAFQSLEGWQDSIDELQAKLKLMEIRFPNAEEFMKAYKRYVSS